MWHLDRPKPFLSFPVLHNSEADFLPRFREHTQYHFSDIRMPAYIEIEYLYLPNVR